MGIVLSCVSQLLPRNFHRSSNGIPPRANPVPSDIQNNIEEGVSVTQRASNGTYFGTHFLMGGERFDVAKPDTFLFGDNSDLELIGMKPVDYPYHVRGLSHPFKVLNSLINVRRDSVKFVKVDSEESCYRLEFVFDSDTDCYIQIHFFAKEVVEGNDICFKSKNNQPSSEKVNFSLGAEQSFNQFLFYPQNYNFPFHYEGGIFFPVVIEVRAYANLEKKSPTQVQATLCSIERSSDQTAAYILKPLKQKLIVDGVTYLMQEIYGIENKEMSAKSIDDNSAECIICMGMPRDTVILPCRHLCICCGCAEALRFRLQNCPICRSPFKGLFRFLPANLEGLPNQPARMTLVEALNGSNTHATEEGNDLNRRDVHFDVSRHSNKKQRKGKASKAPTQQAPIIDHRSVEIEMQPMTSESSQNNDISADLSTTQEHTTAEVPQFLPHATVVRVSSDSTNLSNLPETQSNIENRPISKSVL
uniref:RING-type E3 ubiquitin transferase n=1 Tax=Panagrolaimus sp. JU765 TaxID=591449 RepID=A0AC34Q5X1_9BILA